MKRFILVLIFIISSSITANCAPSIFISPGVKLGYTWGEKGGFTWGWEVSCGAYYDHSEAYGLILGGYYGFSAGMDWTKSIRKSYFNIEAGVPVIGGGSIGPTLINEKDSSDIGISFTVYTLGFVMPYFTYTSRFNHKGIMEAGSYFKWPLPVVDNVPRFGM